MVVMMTEASDPPRARRLQNLTELRIDAGYYSLQAFCEGVGLSKSEVWKAENNIPISRRTAAKIIIGLREKGFNYTIGDIDWTVKPVTKKRPK